MIKRDIDIEDLLVWAYRDQAIDRRAGRDVASDDGAGRDYFMRAWASTWGRVSEYAQLGTFVDTSFRTVEPLTGGDGDDDALAVHNAVLTLPSEACVLIVIHGRAATRPGLWSQGAPRLVAALRTNGKPKMIRHNDKAVACVIRWTHDPERWEWEKQQYRVWRAALDVLADELAGKLKVFRVMRARAERAPWAVLMPASETAA